jgi:Arc/MetJ family transcription regulator
VPIRVIPGESPAPNRHPDKPQLASHTKQAISYGMKMTLDIDAKKVEEAMAQYGVSTKTEVIDMALQELLRKKAVERLMGSMGKFPNMITNDKLEAAEKRRLNRARRR